MPDSLDGLRREIDRLRDWRHDDVEPALASLVLLRNLVESIVGRTAALVRRLTDIERSVVDMAHSAERLADAAEAFERGRASVFKPWQKRLAVLVAGVGVLTAVGAFALQIYTALT